MVRMWNVSQGSDRGVSYRIGIIIPFLLVLRTSIDPFNRLKLLSALNLNIAALYGAVLGLVSILFVVYRWREEGIYLDRISRAFILFLLTMLFIGVPVAYQNFGVPGLVCSFREWVRIMVIFSVFLAFFNLSSLIDRDWVINLFFFSLIVPMIMGTYQLFESHRLFFGVKRIWGAFVHPNPFSFYLALFMGLTLWKIWKVEEGRQVFLWILLLLWQATLLCFTWSKGGLILAFVVLGGGMFLMRTSRRKMICLAVMIFMIGLWLASPSGKQRIRKALPHMQTIDSIVINKSNNLGNKEGVKKGYGTVRTRKGRKRFYPRNSSDWRLVQWKALLESWRKKPLLGYGLNTSWKFVSPLHKQAHNDYVKFLVETGILGFAVWIALLVVTGVSMADVRRHNPQDFLSGIVFLLFVGAQICASFANIWDATIFQLYMWALIGLLLGERYSAGKGIGI